MERWRESFEEAPRPPEWGFGWMSGPAARMPHDAAIAVNNDQSLRSPAARWKHGAYSQERRDAYLRLKAEYAAFNAVQRAYHAAVLARMRLPLRRQRVALRNAAAPAASSSYERLSPSRCMGFILTNAEKP
jgi:hypothetical protein